MQSLAAIKILRDAWLSPARRDRFKSEQRMLAQLNHPSIARLYDADTLYIGVYAYDSEPDRIIKGAMSRDGNLGAGDLVRIFLDPGQTRRDGYSFEVGSAGGRRDALVQNNGDFIVQWDTIWNARTSIAADGWIAEIAIPFRSLSYDRQRDAWGFDFTRAIRRKEERVRWTSYATPINLFDIKAMTLLRAG